MEIALVIVAAVIIVWFLSGVVKQRRFANDPKTIFLATKLLELANTPDTDDASKIRTEIEAHINSIPQSDKIRSVHMAYGIAATSLDGFQTAKIKMYLSNFGIVIR